MDKVNIHKIFSSERESVQLIEPLILTVRDKIGLTDENIFNIMIAATEAVNNAIVHGNKLSPDKKVYFTLSSDESFVEIVVKDEGNGFDPAKLPDPREPSNIFMESGRGVFLIKELTHSTNIKSGDDGTELTMIFKIK